MGASFGSGASQTIFGSSGSGNVLTKSTSIMAVVFFVTSLGLAVLARQQADLSIDNSGLIENLDEITAQQEAAALSASQALDDIPVLAGGDDAGDVPVFEAAEDTDVPALNEDIPALDAGETQE